MEIKTKYSIGEKVFCINLNKIFDTQITAIRIAVDPAWKMGRPSPFVGRIEILYKVSSNSTEFSEQSLFPTREELLKSL